MNNISGKVLIDAKAFADLINACARSLQANDFEDERLCAAWEAAEKAAQVVPEGWAAVPIEDALHKGDGLGLLTQAQN